MFSNCFEMKSREIFQWHWTLNIDIKLKEKRTENKNYPNQYATSTMMQCWYFERNEKLFNKIYQLQ